MLSSVVWHGAHPSEGSISMDVYRRSLLNSLSKKQRKIVSCWPKVAPVEKKSKLGKLFGTYIDAPLRVKFGRDSDVIHFLDHSSGHLINAVRPGTKIVVTLHDLIPLRFPGELSSQQLKRFRDKVLMLKKADAIISVSAYSKREAIDLLELESEKIYVVPNGVQMPVCGTMSGSSEVVMALRAKGADAILLSVGSCLERKNLKLIPGAVRAFQDCSGGKKLGVIRVGKELPPVLAAEIRKATGEEYFVELGRLTDSSLRCLYSQVDVVFVPSLYEGFGLPVLEAFAYGTPVACSSTSSLPEVAAEAATYFHPENSDEAGKAISEAVFDNSIQLQKERIRRAEFFSWEKHVNCCFEIYESLMTSIKK